MITSRGIQIVLVLSLLACISRLYAEPLSGGGTAGDPHVIANFADFQTFADSANAETYWAEGVHTRLDADIDLNPALAGRQTYTTAPIAPDTNADSGYFNGDAFEGVFDGNGHSISNLSINIGDTRADHLGLFGRLNAESATIRNLTVESAMIVGTGVLKTVGLLCGYNRYGTLANCHATGTITGGGATDTIGALCGHSYYGTITRCSSAGSIVAGDSGQRLGGLCGKLEHTAVDQSYSSTAVTAGERSSAIGGFCGRWNGSPVDQCISNGAVVVGYRSVYIGGFCGSAWPDLGTISNSYSTGSVTAESTQHLGGFIGYAQDTSIRNCYSTGHLSNPEGAEGWADGFCGGDWRGDIINCFWDVETSGLATSEGGVGRTTAAMKALDTYRMNEWGNGLWRLDAGVDYPSLSFEDTPGDIIPAATTDLAGTGTEEDPLQIDSPADLLELASGSYYWDKYYVLNADIDLSGETLDRPLLGFDEDNPFSGHFYGRGTINCLVSGCCR